MSADMANDPSPAYPNCGSLFDLLPLGIVFYDLSEKITTANSAAERILGLSCKQLHGMTLSDPSWQAIHEHGLPYPEDMHPVRVAIRTQNDILDVVMGIFNPVLQAHVWLSVSAYPILDKSGGAISGVYAIFEDISARRLVAQEKDELQRNQRALLNAIQETTFLMDRDGKLLVINQVGAQRLNTSAEQLVGKNMFELLPPKVAESRRAVFDKVASKGQAEFFDDERSEHRFSSAIYPIADSNGEVQRFAVYAADITLQYRLQKVDELLAAINQEILQGAVLNDVLTDICRQLVELFRLEVIWLGRKEPHGGVDVLAAAGSATGYVEQLKVKGVRWDDTQQGQGPTGSAIRSGQPQIFHVDHPGFRVWAQIALENYLQSVCAIPLVIRGEIYGAFTLYSSTPQKFDSAEVVSQLQGVATRISSAIESAMELQQVRLLSSALDAAGNGVMITDAQGSVLWVNPAFSKLSGYSQQEMQGKTPRILNSGQQPLEYYQAMWETILGGENWSSETVEKAKNGNIYTVSQTITPIFSEGKLTHFIAIHEDITAQKLAQQRIAHMAHYDELTGLPNRALFYDRLRHELSKARRNESGLSLLYMDLDGFKAVNDRRGHYIGDLLLVAVATRLSKCIRESDTVARLGGDEFAIILSETHRNEDITGVAQKIIEAISAPFDLMGGEASIGISIGIARYSEDAGSEDELMKRADQAMYEAKSAGKNTYRLVAC